MKIRELTGKIEQTIIKHNINQSVAADFAQFSYYGLRFENKVRVVGEVCNNSRHNFDRDDEREFPEYGTESYESMMELGGASAWYIDENGTDGWKKSYICRRQSEDDDLMVVTDHCYIIGGDVEATHDDPDQNEIVIKNAIVVEVLF